MPNKIENKKKLLTSFLIFMRKKKYVANPLKIARNAGINIKAIGIKNLKFSSNVNEIVIQYRLERKYPKPKNQPYQKDLL
tara:strand:+ start:1123 stop:1362 length:240 start_codon:yes stop_codon:yes gene_type:complete